MGCRSGEATAVLFINFLFFAAAKQKSQPKNRLAL